MTVAPEQAVDLDTLRHSCRAGGPYALARATMGHLVRGSMSPLHRVLNSWHLLEATREPGDRTAVAAPRGHGKACSLDTVLPTPTGYTTMRDVQAGDLLLGTSGKPVRVLAKHPVLTGRDCYRVTTSDGYSVVVDGEHLWTIHPRDVREPQTLTTRELLGVQRGRRRLPLTAPLDLPGAALPVDPYTLGVFLSEGSRNHGLLTLNRDDADHVEQRIRDAGQTTRRTPSGEKPGSVGVRVEGLTTRLRALDVLDERSIPVPYLRGARAARQALLEAIVDCDGYVSPAGQVEITTTASRAYAHDLAELVHTLGMRCQVYTGRATIDGRDVGPKWRVTWTPYQPVCSLPRKVARQRTDGPQRARQYARLIDRIEPVESEPVQCITVDAPDHLYLVGRGMVPTHNTTGGVEVPALWHAAYCTRRYTLVISDTYSQAVKRLETISTEIETNGLLRELFPDLRPARDTMGNVVAWRDDELALACGCRIVAAGAGKSIRGAKAGEHRPDLALLDDLEDEESVATEAARERRLRYITRNVLPLAGPMRGLSVLWVGTILSRSALLNAATGAALEQGQARPAWARSWGSHVFRAERRGTPALPTRVPDPEAPETYVLDDNGEPLTYDVAEPLWNELTREDLAAIRYAVGPTSYAAEYLSDPVEAGTSMVAPPRPVRYVNPDAPPLERLVLLPDGGVVPVSTMTRAAALDPQYAKAKTKTDQRAGTTSSSSHDPDLAAVAVVGQAGDRTFLLDSWVGRDRHGQAARLVTLAERWGCYAARVETNAAQVVTADQAAADSRVPIIAKASSGDKVTRALGLAARSGDPARPETSRLFVVQGPTAAPGAGAATGAEELLPYLATFPHGRYDDPVDAVVMALELAVRGSGSGTGTAQARPELGGGRER